MTKPPLQKSGMCPHQASPGPRPRQSAILCAEVVSAPCECTTAFACAVVPEVKKMTAGSRGETAASGASSVSARSSQRVVPGALPVRSTTLRSSGASIPQARHVVVPQKAGQRDQQLDVGVDQRVGQLVPPTEGRK